MFPYTYATLSNQIIWFLDQNKGFISYNLVNNNVRHYTWKALLGEKFKGNPSFQFENKYSNISTDEKGDILFYFRNWEEIWKYGCVGSYFRWVDGTVW